MPTDHDQRTAPWPLTRAAPPQRLLGALASDAPRRLAGSAAELRAAELLAGAWEDVGVASVQLPTRVARGAPWLPLLYLPCGLLAAFVGLLAPWVGVALALLTLVAVALECDGRRLLTRAAPTAPARNVLAIVPPARRELRRLVVVAQLDTPAATAGERDLNAWLSRNRDVLTLALLALNLAGLLYLAIADSLTAQRLIALPAILLAGTLLGLWKSGRAPSTNAGDGAANGDLAALLGLAEAARAQPAQWVELWLLATAGGESGGGLRAFLTSNRFAPEATAFIHLLGVGAGPPRPALRDGRLWPRWAAPELPRVFARAGQANATAGAPPLPRLWHTSPAQLAARAGYAALTVTGRTEAGATDTAAQAAVAQIVTVLGGVLRELDAEADERERLAQLARGSAPARSSGEREHAL